MSLKLFTCICLSCTAAMLPAATAENVIFPGPAAKQFQFRPSDNGADVKAFTQSLSGSELEVKFNDRDNQDNYLHVDLGKLDCQPYYPGGYVEIEAEIDQPVLRIALSLSDPVKFWPQRLTLEPEAPMKTGRNIYRYYLDTVTAERVKSGNDHLYLFLHDYSGKSRGQCTVKITRIALMPQTADWKQDKILTYSRQYNWRKFQDLGQYYRGKYDRLVPWSEFADNPFLRRISLNGEWRKKYYGEKTWKYDFLKDISFAAPEVKLEGAGTVTVPEPPVEDQAGGHYWYKREFTFDKSSSEGVYLRFEDLADSAEIYINGQWIGTQSSVRKRHEWITVDGSRHTVTSGKPVKEVVKWQHFERCGIKCPFNPADMPDADEMLLPVYTGQYEWPYVFDITSTLVSGKNTIAVRLYGNPVKGWWIFKHNSDRAARNIFGILGRVELLVDEHAVIASVSRNSAGKTGSDGIAAHRIECKLDPRLASIVDRAVIAGNNVTAEMKREGQGGFTAELKLPAKFADYNFSVTVFDRDGRAVDRRNLIFNGSVVELRDGRIFVNGDRYVIRGINASLGVEFDHDRTVTRREWLRQLRFFQQLGFNTLRLEGCTAQHLQDAFEAGMMVMPVYASGSCNTTMTVLGNMVNPDYEFNTDAHKEMVITLAGMPNIILWNSGNENHHSGGYNDKEMLDKYLETAQQSIRRFDPSGRGVVYANLDTYGTSWFFSAGQDVLGYNTYGEPDSFRKMMNKLYNDVKKPVVFTEWGFHDNEPKAVKDRNDNVEGWEKRMTEKARIIFDTSGSLGGFLYAYHGELHDDRGRAFLQQLMSPYKLYRQGQTLVFENNDVCPLRKVSLLLSSDTNLPAAEYSADLQPGQTVAIPLPEKTAAVSGLRLEMRFETHRGLNHFYSRMINQIETVKK